MSMDAPFSPTPDAGPTGPGTDERDPARAEATEDELRRPEDGAVGEDALDAALEDREEPTFRPPQP